MPLIKRPILPFLNVWYKRTFGLYASIYKEKMNHKAYSDVYLIFENSLNENSTRNNK